MDIQTRKLNLISYLANLQDEEKFEQVERFVLYTKNEYKIPFSQAELVVRINQSENDLVLGNTKTQAELEKLSNSCR